MKMMEVNLELFRVRNCLEEGEMSLHGIQSISMKTVLAGNRKNLIT